MKNVFAIVAVAIFATGLFFVNGCVETGIPPNIQQNIDKYVGYWNTGQFEGIENVVDSTFELLESPLFESKKGIENLKQLITETRIAYPDFKLELNETVYDRNKLAVIWTCSGTNTGPGEHPPTGKVIRGQGISFIHFKDGKIKDEWLANNNVLWMKQLGYTFVPPAADTLKISK